MHNQNLKVALELLKYEIAGNVQDSLKKLSPNYSMTWVNYSFGKLFRRVKRDKNFIGLIQKIYKIRGRNYDIKNITASKNVVMIELVESYFDNKTKIIFRTPLVLVLEFKNGKVLRGRHYYDPKISKMKLSKKRIDFIYK